MILSENDLEVHMMNRLRQLRKSAGVSVKELSELVDATTKTIERHENNYPINHYILKQYANVFQLSMEFILGAENNCLGIYDKEIMMIESNLFKERFRAYNYEKIDNGKRYYLIGEIHYGEKIDYYGVTKMNGFTEDKKYEKRVPRLLNKPNKEKYEEIFGKLMIINTAEEVFALWQYGGGAIIEEKLCEKYYINLFEEGFLVERTNWNLGMNVG